MHPSPFTHLLQARLKCLWGKYSPDFECKQLVCNKSCLADWYHLSLLICYLLFVGTRLQHKHVCVISGRCENCKNTVRSGFNVPYACLHSGIQGIVHSCLGGGAHRRVAAGRRTPQHLARAAFEGDSIHDTVELHSGFLPAEATSGAVDGMLYDPALVSWLQFMCFSF